MSKFTGDAQARCLCKAWLQGLIAKPDFEIRVRSVTLKRSLRARPCPAVWSVWRPGSVLLRPRLFSDLVKRHLDDARVDAVVDGAHELHGTLGRVFEHEVRRGKLAAHEVGRHASSVDKRARVKLAILKVFAVDNQLPAGKALAPYGVTFGVGGVGRVGHAEAGRCVQSIEWWWGVQQVRAVTDCAGRRCACLCGDRWKRAGRVARIQTVRTLIQTGDAITRFAEATVRLQQAIVQAVQHIDPGAAEEIDPSVIETRSREVATNFVPVTMFYIYQDVPTATLQAYADFYTGEAGRWYQQVRSNAEAYAEEQAAERLVTGVRQAVAARGEE